MTYALSVKSFSCWSCDHFRPISVEDSVQGYCRKNAPCALDLYGAVSEDLLTTKGDLLTRDPVQLVRQPVGANDTWLTADSTLTNGIGWKQPLTTEGDLLTRNATTLTRLANSLVNGQVLTVDDTLVGKMNWKDPPMILHFQAGWWTATALGGFNELGRTGLTAAATPPNLPISSTNIAEYFNNAKCEPFLIPAEGYVIAFSLMVAAVAVHTAAVGINPFMRFSFYVNDGATELARFNIDVPVPAAQVAVSDSVLVDNCIQVFYELPIPQILHSPAFGWRIDLGDGSTDTQIYAARNVLTQVYYKVAAPTPLPAMKMMSSETIDIEGDTKGLDGDDEELDGDDEELDDEKLEIPFLGNINPNLLSTAESLQKWCPILVAPNEWCGDYKPASHTVPAIPPFVYPSPPPGP